MKKIFLVFAICTSLNSLPAYADCILGTTQGSIIFFDSSVKMDDEYKTYKEVQYDGIAFYLRAGHGVARLEVWVADALVDNTFYSYGRDPKQLDTLILRATTVFGEAVEAKCQDVDAIIGQ